MPDPSIICIACSIFKPELEVLKAGIPGIEIQYLDSMLHMYPAKLEQKLTQTINQNPNKKILLLFGDCHANMIDYNKNSNLRRIEGINCCNIFLETSRYRQIRKEGAFILIHEWVKRWEEIFKQHLGLKKNKTARMFMSEMHKKFVYLDTEIIEVPYHLLDELSEYCGLPYSIEKCDISILEQKILNLLKDISA